MSDPEVIVIGGGAVGLSVAEALSHRGCPVAVLEAGRLGAGASAGNAGWITPSLATPVPGPGVVAAALRWLVDPSGPLWIRPTLSAAMLRWTAAFLRSCDRQSYARGLSALQALVAGAAAAYERLAERGVRFELHDEPLLYPCFGQAELAHLSSVAADLREAGARQRIDTLGAAELLALEPALDGGRLLGGLRASEEARVRPETLTSGLAEALRARGVDAEEGTYAHSLTRDGAGWALETARGRHRARAVVLAAGVGCRKLLAGLGLRLPIAAAKGYSRTYSDGSGSPSTALYLEAPKVAISHFEGAVRVSGTLELGARGLSLSARRLAAIAGAARDALPGWTPAGAPRDWAGMRSLSPDGLPFIGAVPGRPGLFLATAHATLGITLAPLTGELIADAVLGDRVPSFARAITPARALELTRT